MEILEKLGLNWQSFLFHLLNLAIIVFAAWLFLHKPLSKMIQKHNQRLADMKKENEELVAEAEENRQNIDSVKAKAQKEAVRITNAAAASAAQKTEEIVEAAKEQAKNILDTAQKEADTELERVMEDCKRMVADASIEIAGKILEREVTHADNQKIIDDCIRELLS